MTNVPISDLLAPIAGTLTEVRFIWDYVNFQLGDWEISCLIWPTVHTLEGVVDRANPSFERLLVSCIGKNVCSVNYAEGQFIALQLVDDITIRVSLLPQDYVCAEAKNILKTSTHLVCIWFFRIVRRLAIEQSNACWPEVITSAAE